MHTCQFCGVSLSQPPNGDQHRVSCIYFVEPIKSINDDIQVLPFFVRLLDRAVPKGYEDSTGFHYGDPKQKEASISAAGQ